MTVDEALRAIICQNGIEILRFPNRIQSMIMDYSGSHERDVQLFCLSCQKGLLLYAPKLLRINDGDELNNVAIKAKEMLQNDAFMDERFAIESVNMLLSGLGIRFKISINTPKPHDADGSIKESKREFGRSDVYSIQFSDSHKLIFDRSLIQHLMEQERNGNVSAMISLGNCYFHGIAVTEDWIIAESYFRKALSHGNDSEQKEAANRINEIYNRRQSGF